MSGQIKSDNTDLVLNAGGSGSDIKFQANGVEKASISSAGAFTSTTIDATKLTGDLPAISGANLTGITSGATSINGLSDGTTSADNNIGLGSGAVDSITTGDNNTGVGVNALTANTTGARNTAEGYLSLSANTTGASNTAMGAYSLASNTTASYNTAVGDTALYTNTTGHNHTAVGDHSLYANTTGTHSTAFGATALQSNTTGGANVAVGSRALETSTTASSNTAVGYKSLLANTTGYKNTAVGRDAGVAQTDSVGGTYVGNEAGVAVTGGHNNTCVGNSAGYNITTGSYNVMLGMQTHQGSAGQSHGLCIGHNLTAYGNEFAFGKASNKVYNDFTVNASFTRTSDERKKTNIADATLGLDFINDLRTVTFKWKENKDFPETFDDYQSGDDADYENQMNTDVTMHGMLAQDVKAALDTAGVTTFGGWKEEHDGSQSISQELFIYPLIKAIQELSAKNTALETSNENLESRIAALES